MEASFLEIYNEEIRDLLAVEKNLKYEVKMAKSSTGSSSSTSSNASEVFVTNLIIEEVTSAAKVRRYFDRTSEILVLCI